MLPLESIVASLCGTSVLVRFIISWATLCLESLRGPKAVGNEAAFIDFGGTNDVGTVSVNNVSTIVNAEMGKLTQTATVLAQEALCTLWQVVLRTTLGTSVEGDDDDVGFLLQIVEDALNSL